MVVAVLLVMVVVVVGINLGGWIEGWCGCVVWLVFCLRFRIDSDYVVNAVTVPALMIIVS